MKMLFLTLFLLIIIVGYPIWDYFYMKKIKSKPINKWRMYGEIMITQWIIVIIFLVYWFFTKRTFNDLFSFETPLFSFQTESLLALGLGAGLSIVMFALIIRFSKTIRNKISEALTDESI